MNFFNKLLKDETKDWSYSLLEPTQVPGHDTNEDIVPNQFYMEFWLKSMRIVHVRKGFNKFFPVFYSFLEVPVKASEKGEFNVVTKPNKLEELDSRTENIITTNIQLLDKLPYVGGTIAFQSGLFSVKSRDLAKPVLDYLENLSKTAGVSFINQALTFAQPIKDGFNLIAGGNDDASLEVGLNTNLGTEGLKTGFYIVARTKQSALKNMDLKLQEDTFKLLDGDRLLTDFPYYIFEIKKSKQKNTWWNNPEVNKAYDYLKKQWEELKKSDIEKAFNSFQIAVITAKDIIQGDRVNIIKQVKVDQDAILALLPGDLEMARGMSKPKSKVKELHEFNIYK